jgi:NitT/TauT family transport system permease protein
MTSLDRPRVEERAQSVSRSPRPAPETAPARPPHDEDAGPPRTFWARHEHALLGTISMLVFLSFWEASVDLGWVNPLFTSSPSRIVRTAIEMFADGSILVDMQVSGFEFIVGYGAAIIIGVPLGILMGWYSRLNAVLDPFVNALYATPRIALMPLIIIWFGIDLSAKIAIIFLSTVFPILVNTMTGVRTMERDFVKVARSFGASDRQIFLTVALPSSVPLLLTGLRLGLGHALVGIVVSTEHLTVGTLSLLPGQHSDSEEHGGDETIYVLEGVLNVRTWSDGSQGWHELHPGDGFYCPSGTPHRYSNIGSGIVKAVFGVAPRWR